MLKSRAWQGKMQLMKSLSERLHILANFWSYSNFWHSLSCYIPGNRKSETKLDLDFLLFKGCAFRSLSINLFLNKSGRISDTCF
jgi:hypothetical protein